MGIRLTAEEKRRLQRDGSLVDLLETDNQPFTCYHNPETGQEFPHLPADPYSMARYARRTRKRGPLAIGPAPEHLRRKWQVGQTEREAKYEQRLKEARKNPDLIESLKDEGGELPEAIQSIVNEAVSKAVQAALRAAGLPLPDPEATIASPVVEAPKEPVQGRLL